MASKFRKRDGSGGGVSLPVDVVFDVLARVPAKALCRFRCVCKGWRALISDPAFIVAQKSHAAAGPLIVGVFASTSAEQAKVRLLDKGGDVLRVFHVNSPVLLAPTCMDLIFVDRRQLGATIINPATGRASQVVGTSNPYWAGMTSTLVSDYSFGRASPSGDYKVVNIVIASTRPRSYYGYSEWCLVATITNGGAEEPAWRQRPWSPFRTSPSCEHKASVNGVLYFMPFVLGSHSHNGNQYAIAAFDLESEEWKPRKIRGPRLGLKKAAEKWSIAIVELKGTLCMVHNVQLHTSLGGHYANIWLLMDHSRGIWVKEYTIQMPGTLLLSTKPLDVLGDGTTLLLLNTFLKAGDIESCHQYIIQFYNSSTKTFTNFMEMAEGFIGRMAFYTGNLLS